MELVEKKENLEFKWEDVTFHIRQTFTAHDRFAITTTPHKENRDGGFVFDTETFYATLIQLFVVDWEGVTQNGFKVQYSFARLKDFPASKDQGDVFLALGGFIRDKVLIPNTEKVEEIKKKSVSV